MIRSSTRIETATETLVATSAGPPIACGRSDGSPVRSVGDVARRAGVGRSMAGLLLFIAIWFILTLFFPAYILPSPVTVVRECLLAGSPACLRPGFGHDLALTLYRVLAGFACAFLLGSAAGVVAFIGGRTQHLSSLMLALEVIPGTILGIILLLALGLGSAVPIALAALLAMPAIAVNTANALSKKNVALEQYLLSSGAGRRDLITYLYLPTLVPTTQSNLNIGFGLAIKLVILGEFIGAQDGMGYLLNVARIYFNMKEVFFYLLVVVLVSALFQSAQSLLFTASLQKYFFPE
jgi:NitT/TauT family transport system permease protein